jgi:acetylglutamate kinase
VKVLVKIGGTLLDSAEGHQHIACEINAASRSVQIVVVHGGGKQMTRFLSERGIHSQFVHGLRVTTPETMDAVIKVLAGSVNHELLAAFNRAGARAVGLSGIDAGLAEAEQMDPVLGSVGRVVRCHPELLDLLTANGYLPVVACVAGDSEGNLYNVNADQMAVACAAAYHADQLIFLTDVDGVMDGSKAVRTTLSVRESERLISEGIATGGMHAKLDAAASALRQGVKQVFVVRGSVPNIIEDVLAGRVIGTQVVLEEAPVP